MKISTIICACATATACLADFSVYTRALAGQEAVKLGDVQLDSETGEPVFTLSEQIEQATEGTYCIGVKSAQGEFVCSSLVELEKPLHYNLVISLKPNDEVSSVSLQPSKAEGIAPVVQRSVKAAEPNLKSQQRLGQKGSSARPAGEAADDDEQLVSISSSSVFPPILTDLQPEKSFIQKYWMYIVPGLIMFLLTSNGQEESK